MGIELILMVALMRAFQIPMTKQKENHILTTKGKRSQSSTTIFLLLGKDRHTFTPFPANAGYGSAREKRKSKRRQWRDTVDIFYYLLCSSPVICCTSFKSSGVSSKYLLSLRLFFTFTFCPESSFSFLSFLR